MTTRRAQRILRLLPAWLLLLAPVRLTGQQQPGTSSTWADDVLKQEGYGPVRTVTTDQQERR